MLTGCLTVVLIPQLKIAWVFYSMYVTGLGGAKPGQTNAADCSTAAETQHFTSHTQAEPLHIHTQQDCGLDSGTGAIRTGLTRACCSYGEVSDPYHHPGERPPAYDQPLLPRCEGPRAEPGASYAGQGPGCPAPVPCPDGAAGV